MTGRVDRLLNKLRGHRRLLAVVLYGVITGAAYFTAYLLRFEFQVPADHLRTYATTAFALVAIRAIAFRAFRLTRERWRYASTPDVARLVGGTVVGSVAFWVIFRVLLDTPVRVPLSVIAIEALLTCGTTAGVWLAYRLLFEHSRRSVLGTADRRVLIIGAGEAGNMLAREMLRGRTRYIPVGFVDDDPHMWGATVQGLEVIGSTADLAVIARTVHADELILAVPSAPPAILRRIVERCEETPLPFKVLPGIAEVIAGNVTLNQLRDVEIEDLLGREPIQLELPELSEDLAGRSVLITGAAGSIGSELARQVALHKPATLVLFDQAETDLFFVDAELRELHADVHIVPVIGDIFDAVATEQVFASYTPDRVFHAAAYKHVPLMESNAREAIRNNVVGTWRVAECAGRYGTAKFILVSTDKAVRPANVMGATKRLAELVVLELQEQFPHTAYGAVRFGNVLGSNGSVLPIFKRQLQDNKPLTVTDPYTTRYFMTIPEAVQLILQASLLPALRGHIAMLDMGDPVRIADLATKLLRLSGVTDLRGRITYTGLRPGEKLHEELSAPDEVSIETPIAKVQILQTTIGRLGRITPTVLQWEKAFHEQADQEVLGQFVDMFAGISAPQMRAQQTALSDTTRAIR